jgi:hypothetical protein
MVALASGVAILALFLASDRSAASGASSPTVARLVEPSHSEAPLRGPVRASSSSRDRAAVEDVDSELDVPRTTSEGPADGSVIHGFVRDDLDTPVEGARVALHTERRTVATVETLDDGSFRFEGVKTGEYSVRVDPTKLPERYLAPWRQDVPSAAPGNDYQAKQVRVPQEGGTFEVALRVFERAVAWGVVVGSDGEPVEGVQVRLQGSAASGQPSSLSSTTYTDVSGRFEMKDVYPGRFIVEVYSQAATNENDRDQPAPIPYGIQVAAGGRYDLGTIRLGGGGNSVVGQVIDQSGVPFEGLPVIAYPAGSPGEGFLEYKMNVVLARSETDADGYYRLDRLPDAGVKIHVGADYMVKPLGEAQAAFWIYPLEIVLSGSREHHALPSVLPRSRPFRIHGNVTLDESWARARRASPEHVSIVVSQLDPEAPPIPNRPSYLGPRRFDVNPATGEFDVLLETPHNAIKVTFSCRLGRSADIEEIVYDLPPNGELELFPHFPHESK